MQPSKSLLCLVLAMLLDARATFAQAPEPSLPVEGNDSGAPASAVPPPAAETPPAVEASAQPSPSPAEPPAPPAAVPAPPPSVGSAGYSYQTWGLPPPAFATQSDRQGHLPPPRLQAIEQREPRRYGRSGASFSFGMGGAYQFRRDAGYARLGAKDPQTELDMFASYDVAQLLPDLVVAVGASYRHGQDGDAGELTVSRHALLGELTIRYKWLRWLAPQARAGFGWQRLRAELKEQGGSLDLEDTANDSTGLVGAGLIVHTPTRAFETHRGRFSALSFGVLIEGGYAFSSPASFRLHASSEGEVAQQAVSIGKLDASAGYLRILAVTRF